MDNQIPLQQVEIVYTQKRKEKMPILGGAPPTENLGKLIFFKKNEEKSDSLTRPAKIQSIEKSEASNSQTKVAPRCKQRWRSKGSLAMATEEEEGEL